MENACEGGCFSTGNSSMDGVLLLAVLALAGVCMWAMCKACQSPMYGTMPQAVSWGPWAAPMGTQGQVWAPGNQAWAKPGQGYVQPAFQCEMPYPGAMALPLSSPAGPVVQGVPVARSDQAFRGSDKSSKV